MYSTMTLKLFLNVDVGALPDSGTAKKKQHILDPGKEALKAAAANLQMFN